MEYLYYESWWYDRHIAEFKHLQTWYEMAWREVIDSKAGLGDSGTELVDWNSVIEHERWLHSEEEAAREAVESAKSAISAVVETETDPYRSPFLVAAERSLYRADKYIALIKAQRDRIGVFYRKKTRCEIAKKKVDNHSVLLHWILKQIPLIEAELAELKEAKAAGGTSGGRNGGSTEDQKCHVGRENGGRGSSNEVRT